MHKCACYLVQWCFVKGVMNRGVYKGQGMLNIVTTVSFSTGMLFQVLNCFSTKIFRLVMYTHTHTHTHTQYLLKI